MIVIQQAVEDITNYCLSCIDYPTLPDAREVKKRILTLVVNEIELFIKDELKDQNFDEVIHAVDQFKYERNTDEYFTLLYSCLTAIPHAEYLLEGRLNGLRVSIFQKLTNVNGN